MPGPGHNPYRRSIRVTAIVTGVCVASVGLGVLLTALGVGKSPVLFLPIPIALFGLILLPILYFSGRRQGRQIDALLSGGHLARWTYGEDEWRRFSEKEWTRARGQARKAVINVAWISAVAGVIVGISKPVLGVANGAKWGLLIGIPLALVVSALIYLIGRWTYRSRQRSPGEAYIGRDGVFQDGSYTTWSDISAKLISVKFEPADPATVRFDIRGHRGAVQQLRVLVPAGKEDEARVLVDTFNQPVASTSFTIERTALAVSEANVTVDVPVASQQLDASAAGELQGWLDGMMAKFQPDQLQFREGETIGGVFQRIIAEEEVAVRKAGDHPLRDVKLRALEELRKQFS